MLIKNVARYFSQAKNSGLFVLHMKIFMVNYLLISFVNSWVTLFRYIYLLYSKNIICAIPRLPFQAAVPPRAPDTR